MMADALASLRARIDAQRAKAADSGIPFCPQKPHPAQARFLALVEEEALFGGAAGPGKSSALLMSALQYVDRPKYSGLLLRKTYKELSQTGSIMDRLGEWLRPTAARWNGDLYRWTFPSGARLTFGYCESYADVFRYQGPEYHFVAVDELTTWAEERTWTYFDTRIRRVVGDDTPLRMRAATNPGNVGHDWVFKRFVNPGHPSRPFIPALMSDNPSLNQEEYERKLGNQPEAVKLQLLHGIWVKDTEGLVYAFDATRNAVQELPDLDGWHCVLAVDLGASQIKPTTAFAILLWSAEHEVTYVVRAWAEAGLIPSTIAERCHQVLELWPHARVVMDIGALGAGYAEEMRQRHRLRIEPAQKRDKLGNRQLLNGALQQSRVVLLAPECAMLVDELTSLIWAPGGLDSDKTQPDHCTDALLYGWRAAQSWRAAFHTPEPKPTSEEAWEKSDREKYWRNKSDPLAGW